MSGRRWIGILAVLVLAGVMLSGCDFPTPSATATPTPICDSSDLAQPIPSGPVHNQTDVSTLPTILWSYGAGYECQPNGFILQIARDQLFDDIVVEVETGAFDTSWTATSALDPATEYWWRVAGKQGYLDFGPWSERQRFFTGPTCSAAELVAPIPLSPPDGGIMDEPWGGMYFEYPAGEACLPQYYRMLLSTSPDFSDPSLNGWIPHPAEAWGPGDAFVDCTTYYWSAVPVVGSTEGPGSTPWSFFVDLTGACTTNGSISGLVWHDLCAIPYESDGPLYPGCIELPGGGRAADGVYDPSEPGLAGVTVDLGSGPCPSTGYATALTDADGNYTFPSVPPGDYCVSVDPLSHGNDLVLIPGGWTYPDRDVTVAEYDVTVGEDEDLEDEDFGWDFQFLPAPPTPVPSPTFSYYSLLAIVDANCRIGPGLPYEAVGFLLEGERAEVNARNGSSTWFRIYLPSILGNCWISEATVEFEFDAGDLPIVVLPSPTPPACTSTLGPEACAAAGGTYRQVTTTDGYCDCP